MIQSLGDVGERIPSAVYSLDVLFLEQSIDGLKYKIHDQIRQSREGKELMGGYSRTFLMSGIFGVNRCEI